MNRRAVALLAVFAIALSGTGLASLAVLTDTVDVTVNASITTINLTANGTKHATINLADGGIPGDFRYASVVFTNTGTGYVRIPTGTNPGSNLDLAQASAVNVQRGVSPSQCNAAGVGTGDFSTGAQSLSAPLWSEPFIQLDAGNTLNICLWYRLGQTGGTYTASTFSIFYNFPAFYP
jgi:hypothetical protein